MKGLVVKYGEKTYKVGLTDKEGTESTVLFSESGEVLK